MSQENYYEEFEEKKSGWRGCLVGCGIAAGILLVVVLAGVWWVSNNWRGMLSGAMADGLEAAIEESEFPDAEKEELRVQVRRVSDGFAEGSITGEQLQRIMEGFFESPLMSTFLVKALEEGYLNKSGFADEEKQEAKVTLQRFTSGVMQEKIAKDAIDEVLAPVSEVKAEGEREMKDKVTDEELRTALALAKKYADEAEIPNEIEPVDPSEELRVIIDQALAEPADAPAE